MRGLVGRLRGIGPLDRRARLQLAGDVAVGALLAVVLILTQDRPVPLLVPIAFGAVCALVNVIASLRRWAVVGGRPEAARIRRAIRTGVLPEDAVPQVWVPALVGERRTRSGARVSVPVITGLTAFTVSLHAGAATALLVGAVVVTGGAWTVMTFVDAHRSLPRLDALLLQLAVRWEALLHPDAADQPTSSSRSAAATT